LQWLYQARKHYGLNVLNYTITCNHVHLLVADDGERNTIPDSIKLAAGRTGQEFNERKGRRGAFWEDRYHATAAESGDHLARCIVYIDTNMVRAGVVSHPSQWPFSGYNEIQRPKRKNALINHERLRELLGIESIDDTRRKHKGWTEAYLEEDWRGREEEWTASIAVGSRRFADNVKAALGPRARGRKVLKSQTGYQVREMTARYHRLLGVEKAGIEAENAYFWDINS